MTFFKFAKNLVRPFFHLLYRIEYRGKENIPTDKGFIACSNHISNADPFFMAFAIKKDMAFMAKNNLFKNPILRAVLNWLKMIPVDRGAGDMESVNRCIDVVKKDGVLGIFPEGTRGKNGELRKFKSGVMYIAKAAEADILPIGITTPDGSKLKLFKKVIINIGEVMPFESLGLETDDRRALPRSKKLVQETVQQLVNKSRE